MAVAKEQIRQIISENNSSSVADIYTLLKDSFKDILQELMEAELDATLGYEKIIREICRQAIKEMVSKITDKILPQVKEWQSRPLNPVYPFVFMDCIHYKVREDGRILNRAAYVVLGVTVEGYKDILSITVGANETSKFWLGMPNDLKDRGVIDVLFFCVDGLPGFKEAIQAVYPQAEIQRCVIHMLRNSFKYVNYNDLKKFSSDFKASNWENNWEDVSSLSDHSRFLSIPSAFVLLPEFPYSIQEVGCGQRPRKKQSIQCLICHAKKSKRMYKILSERFTFQRHKIFYSLQRLFVFFHIFSIQSALFFPQMQIRNA